MKLSIIIPVFNGENFIQKALNSIPVRNDIEVIIINDGSTDLTQHLCDEWRKNTKLQTKQINLPFNKGLGNAKNIGYNNASGNYINQLDCDDWLLPEYTKVLNELDGSDIVFMDLERNDNSVLRFREDTYKQMGSGCARFIKKEFLGDTRCKDVEWAEDWYLSEDLEQKPHKYKFTGIIGYHYNYPRKRKSLRQSYTRRV